MRRAVRTFAGSTLVVFVIARLIGCGGDDTDTPPDPFASLDGDLPERNLGPDPDANEGDSSVVVAPPSYCNGVVFYASLDGAYGPERGGTPGQAYGNPQLVGGGKFGGAVALYQDQDGGGDAGAAVYYYAPPEGGVPWYPNDVGTVSLWYRGAALGGGFDTPVLWRVMAALPPEIVGGGLALVALGPQDTFGIFNVPAGNNQANILTFPRSLIRPYVSGGEYNHFVTAWQRGDAAGPTAVMVINGGTGKVFDASVDAPDYTDAQPNDAGELLVPYRAIRNRPWYSDASAANFRLGGTATSASDGEIDDVVVWNRLLSLAEMEALYAAPTPVGVSCQLK
jgi:hypothetical protein